MCDQDGEIRLVTAIMEQPEPPCEKFACDFTNRCAKHKLACQVFAEYVYAGDNSRVPHRLPSHGRYVQLFHARELANARAGSGSLAFAPNRVPIEEN